jgi:hypothetical protein
MIIEQAGGVRLPVTGKFKLASEYKIKIANQRQR